MSPETIFQIHLVIGYVACLLCCAAYVSNVWRRFLQCSISSQSAEGNVIAIMSPATTSVNAGRSAAPSTVLPKSVAASRAVSRAEGICSL